MATYEGNDREGGKEKERVYFVIYKISIHSPPHTLHLTQQIHTLDRDRGDKIGLYLKRNKNLNHRRKQLL